MIQRKSHILFFLCCTVFLLCQKVLCDEEKSTFNDYAKFDEENLAPKNLDSFKKVKKEDIDASADSYEYVGSNLIARGHVVIRTKSLQITGDSAIINLKTHDLEVIGHVEFSAEASKTETVDYSKYEKLASDPRYKVSVKRLITTFNGQKKLELEIKNIEAYLSSERISGNLNTGAFEFRKFMFKIGGMYVQGDLAERFPDGKIKVIKAKASTCEYLMDEHAHYSISSGQMILKPKDAGRGLLNYNPDFGEHSLLAVNPVLRLWDFPVFWFPALYKPAESSSFGGRIEAGKTSRWGFFVRLRKDVGVLDEPAKVDGSVMLDIYEKRGIGYGATMDIMTPESQTELFFYGIYDTHPYYYWNDTYGDPQDGMSQKEWVRMKNRLYIPNYRYEFKLSHMTHFTPRLTFRGALDIISDYNFLEDYFPSRYDKDMQPPTYAALDYQGDRFSATARLNVKVNSFDSVMQRLPELRLDFPRQELFKNLYYQGETSFGYYNLRWRTFDIERTDNPSMNINTIVAAAGSPGKSAEVASAYNQGLISKDAAVKALKAISPIYNGYFDDPNGYSSVRFDTLHAFYYPLRFLDAINFIPRAAIRLTAYSNSSKNKVSVNDLYKMIAVNDLDSWASPLTYVNNYDSDGGSQFRFAGELGAELNTKFYRSWQTPKSAIFQIDGLRHVMVPYINYTYIPSPTVDYENLYYFDDVDQIRSQNFFRFGLINRLQTRDDDKIREWISMENFWDFHFDNEDYFNHIGDFSTILSFTPVEGFSLTSKLILDVGGNSDHDAYTVRNGDKIRPGISSGLINLWENSLSYTVSKDWKFTISYDYTDGYRQRATYSMASTLTNINSTSYFTSNYDRHQYASLKIDFPTYIDKRLKGSINITYDVEEDLLDDISLTLTRNFHCWYAKIGIGAESYRDSKSEKVWEGYLGFALGLTAMPGAGFDLKQSVED